MGKLLLFSTIFCAALATVVCAATPLSGKLHLFTHGSVHYSPCIYADEKIVTKRGIGDTFMESFPEYAMEEQGASTEVYNRGVAYVRWDRTACPSGAQVVYKGIAAGSHYSHSGGGSNYQCVTLEPKNFAYAQVAMLT